MPWCAACEWDLDAWDPVIRPARGTARAERRGHRAADRVDRELFAELAGNPPREPVGATALVVAAGTVWLATVAYVVGGVWLAFASRSFWLTNLGIVLVLLAFVIRPRFGRRPRRRRRFERRDSPALFDLLERLSSALGVPMPDDVVLDLEPRIAFDVRGIGRHSLLEIGGALWTTLTPDARVAALAHELAHQSTADPYFSAVVRPVLRATAALVRDTRADLTMTLIRRERRRGAPFLVVFGRSLLRPAARVALAAHVGFRRLDRRAHQYAEYLADKRAAEVAGTAAMVSLFDRAVLADEIDRLVHHGATRRRAAEWPDSVAGYLAARTVDLPLWRQHDARRTSLWDDHAPGGRRARMMLAWPRHDQRVELTESDSVRIDTQLAPWIAAVERDVIGAREFGGRRVNPAR